MRGAGAGWASTSRRSPAPSSLGPLPPPCASGRARPARARSRGWPFANGRTRSGARRYRAFAGSRSLPGRTFSRRGARARRARDRRISRRRWSAIETAPIAPMSSPRKFPSSTAASVAQRPRHHGPHCAVAPLCDDAARHAADPTFPLASVPRPRLRLGARLQLPGEDDQRHPHGTRLSRSNTCYRGRQPSYGAEYPTPCTSGERTPRWLRGDSPRPRLGAQCRGAWDGRCGRAGYTARFAFVLAAVSFGPGHPDDFADGSSEHPASGLSERPSARDPDCAAEHLALRHPDRVARPVEVNGIPRSA